MNSHPTYQGSCFCGNIQFTLTGAPEAMAYCHCDSCRHWSAGPVSAFTLWNPDSLTFQSGEDNLNAFDNSLERNNGVITSMRKWCKRCGGHILTDHPTMGLIDIPTVLIPTLAFQPTFHVHYQETIHPMKDGLPKFKDLPS